MIAPSDVKYSDFRTLYHERSIGKRLKNSNLKRRYKTAKIPYDEAMVTSKKLAGTAALIFFICCTIALSQNARDPKGARPYRGMRMSGADDLFYVTKIESENEENDRIEIEIKFNIPPDPRTLRNEFILINGKPLPPDARIVFNKAGTKIKILLRKVFISDAHERRDRPFRIDLPDAKSFNAIPLYRTDFPDLKIDREYEFRFVNAMPKKMHDGGHGEMHNVRPHNARPDDRENGIHADPSGRMQDSHPQDANGICGEYMRFEED